MLTQNDVFLNFDDYDKLKAKSTNKVREDKITVLETKTGTKICARHNIYDIRIIKEQFIDLQYFPKDVYEENFKPSVILDIGGYIGDLTLYCASTFNSKVHCYEPTPQNFDILKKNLELNPNLKNLVSIFNKGISGNTTSIKLNVQDILGEIHASSNKSYKTNVKSVNVPCISLDAAINDLNEPIIDLVKIDCEGEEFNIFNHCDLNNLSKKVKYLVFEYHTFVNDFNNKMNDLLVKLEPSFDILQKTQNLYFMKSKYI